MKKWRKRIAAVLMSAASLGGVLAAVSLFRPLAAAEIHAEAAWTFTVGDLTFSISQKTYYNSSGTKIVVDVAAVTGCKNSAVTVTIPETVGEYDVVGINSNAFSGCTALKSVTIPDSVTSISDNAFSGCTKLTDITIPDSVTYIGKYAFQNCKSLTDITIPDSVTRIDQYAFNGCKSLTDITLPAGLSTINEATFGGCIGLKSITIPNSVTYFGTSLFYDCESLTDITIPDSVTYIGKNAFQNCKSLTDITIPDSVTRIDQYAFNGCKSLTDITIPDSVTSISDNAFSGCTNLTDITIPDSVTYIGEYAFQNCKSLTDITIPESVTSIGNCAFQYCTGLTDITIPESVTSIGNYAFHYCTGLTDITIPNSVTYFGSCLFYGCKSLTDITLSERLTAIPAYSFYGCKSLTDITIPDSVTRIDQYAFNGCTSLTNVTLPSAMANALTSFEENTFAGTPWSEDNILQLNNRELINAAMEDGTLVVRDGVTAIAHGAFQNCTELTSITIPESVTSIGNYAFQYCKSLTDITIPESVTDIGYCTFENCTSLRSITLPESVTSIGYRAFYYCTGLTDITIPESVTSIGNCAFQNCTSLRSIAIPESLTKIGVSVFRSCRSLTSIKIPEGVTAINTETFSGCTGLKAVTIPTSVTTIGIRAFQNCQGLESVKILYGKKTIGENAFENCVRLNSLKILGANTQISKYAFSGCRSLTSVTLPSNLQTIEVGVFQNCTKLTDITIPDKVTRINEGSFDGCTSLTEITIPDSVRYLGSRAFAHCTSLESVTLPEGLEYNAAVFLDTPWLANNQDKLLQIVDHVLIDGKKTAGKVVIPDGVTAIGDNAFKGNSNLTEITIPEGVTSIGNYAFSGCSGLKSVTVPHSVTEIGSYAFYGCKGLNGIIIPNGAAAVAYNAFNGCLDLITNYDTLYVKIGDLAYRIVGMSNYEPYDDSAFDDYDDDFMDGFFYTIYYVEIAGCSPGAKSVTIPVEKFGMHVSTIASGAFKNCTQLTSITIPNTMGIAASAFSGCTSLKRITFLADSGVPSINATAFSGVTADAFYQSNNSSWTEAVRKNYGGSLTWIPIRAYSLSEEPVEITAECGSPLQLTVEGSSCQWQYKSGDTWENAGIAGAKTKTLTLTATAARDGMQYRCVYWANGENKVSGPVTLRVKPVIVKQPVSFTGEAGQNAVFGVRVEGKGLTYQWQYKSGDTWKNAATDDAKTSFITLEATVARDGMQYRCIVRSANGDKLISDTVTMYVKPTITKQPVSFTGAAGKNAVFGVRAEGKGLTYQWQYKSGDTWKNAVTDDAKTNFITLEATAARDGMQYRCVVRSSSGAETVSDTVTMCVKPTITKQPVSFTGAVGQNAVFGVRAEGSGLTYQWQYKSGDTWKNAVTDDAKTSFITLEATAARDGMQYRCVVRSSSGAETVSDTVKMCVKPTITEQPKSYTGAAGTTARFTVKATGKDLTYQWQFKSGDTWKNAATEDAGTSTLTLEATAARSSMQYRCIVRSASGAERISNTVSLWVR